jgi:membrane protein DedA with SNARE-associated domain
MWERLVSHWGYLAVGLGAFVEGEGVLLSAGALAHAGLLSLPLVVLAGALGSLAWGQAWFFLGTAYGQRFLEPRPKWRARAVAVEHWMRSYGSWLVLAFRFIAGAAIVLPVLFGASRYRRGRFLLLDGVGALAWAIVFACAGFGAGAVLRRLQGSTAGVLEIVVIAVGGVLLGSLVTRLIRSALVRASLSRGSP